VIVVAIVIAIARGVQNGNAHAIVIVFVPCASGYILSSAICLLLSSIGSGSGGSDPGGCIKILHVDVARVLLAKFTLGVS